MANKNCTPSLIKKKRKNISFIRAIFKKGSDNGFYSAISHDNSISLWWIEANQMGQTSCYPCIILQNDEEHAFVSGRSSKEKNSNKALIEKWKDAVTPETIETMFTVNEVSPEEFFREFNAAEARQMQKLFSPKPADTGTMAEQKGENTVEKTEVESDSTKASDRDQL